MKRAIVVDTSIVLKWVLDEPDSAKALALLNGWINEEIVIQAPALLTYEVANALFQRVRKGEITADKARQDHLAREYSWDRSPTVIDTARRPACCVPH